MLPDTAPERSPTLRDCPTPRSSSGRGLAKLPYTEERNQRSYPAEAIAIAKELGRKYEEKRSATERSSEASYDDLLKALSMAIANSKSVVSILETATRKLKESHAGATATIHTLPAPLKLKAQLKVLVYKEGRGFVASLAEADVSSRGARRQEAVKNLRALIAATFLRLQAVPQEGEEQTLEVLQSLIAGGR